MDTNDSNDEPIVGSNDATVVAPNLNSPNLDDVVDASVRLGQCLRDLRLKEGKTQEELAFLLGYSRAQISNAENGRDQSQPLIKAYCDEFPGYEAVIKSLSTGSSARRVKGGAQPSVRANESDEDDTALLFRRRATTESALQGDWYALWESTVDSDEVLNTEDIVITWRRGGRLTLENRAVSAENPQGGYMWAAEGSFYDNQHLLATYLAKDVSVRSKGCFYLVLHPSGQHLLGQWIGCNYDGEGGNGLVVFSRNRDQIHHLMKRHRRNQPIMPYSRD